MAEAEYTFRSMLPTGTVTLLFTDTEGSTYLLQQLGGRYASVLSEMRHLLRTAFQEWNGYEVDVQGDAFFVVFARATDAVSAAVAAQCALAWHRWPEDVAVRVRMGLHTGEPVRSSVGYTGLDVHYTARLMSAAHGGQVVISQTTRDLVQHDLPDGASLRDLGEHRLKNFPGLKHLFQLVISDLPADFPPLRTPDTQFNNLPVQLTSLIGREQEVKQVCTLLRRVDVRFVTLTGTGGIGKTRLGLQVATELLDEFVDGICFVPLAPVSDPALVVHTIAHMLGMEHQYVRQRLVVEHMDYVKAFLQDKRFLLLLDNFEQVLSAAPELAELLIACPQLKILVTSRAVLHIQGEREFPVPPLALPKRTHLPGFEEIAQYPAITLFIQRAQAVKPDFVLTEANAQAIAAICMQLDGLPLAIELAAARVKLLPAQALLQRLTHRLALLTGGAQNVPERQQTLRNTIAWSYNLLDAAEQRLFQRLSVFVGSCTLEAVEAICGAFADGAAQILDGVASLIDKSLLQQTEQEGAEPRLLMLETIREYGLEALAASGEEEITRQAHAAYYLALAEKAEPEFGGPQQAVWLERLEKEHDNLRAAMRWALEQGKVRRRMEMALRLGGALRRFWLVHAHISEGRTFLEQALAESGEVAAPVRAKALIAAANLAASQNDYDRTETLCQESLALFQELGDQPGVAFSLSLLGAAYWIRGNPTKGRSLIEKALVLFREIDDKDQIAWSLYLLALFDGIQGEYTRAYSLFEESLALHRGMQHKRGIAFSLIHMAQMLFVSQGDQAVIRSLLEEGFALSRELDDKDSIAYSYSLQGRIAFSQDDTATARTLLEKSVGLYREVGSLHGIAESLSLLAQVMASQGDYTAAYALYEESLTIARELQHSGMIASCLEGLAGVIVAQGKFAWATQLWGAAEALRDAISVPIPPVERTVYEHSVANARAQLGEKTFAALWAQGRMMTPQQAFAAQGRTMTSLQVTEVPEQVLIPPAGLTAREVEVLQLVARGLTNTEIASELGLSEKTIAHHLTHIFNKTTSENRAAAVAFAIRHGLA